jgi:hypothetical protein
VGYEDGWVGRSANDALKILRAFIKGKMGQPLQGSLFGPTFEAGIPSRDSTSGRAIQPSSNCRSISRERE